MATHTFRSSYLNLSFLITKAAAFTGTVLAGNQYIFCLISHQDSGYFIPDKCNELIFKNSVKDQRIEKRA